MSDIKINEDQILTEILIDEPSGDLNKDIAWISQAPIKVTHIPTGISAIGENQGSQIKNKEKAMELLRERLYEGKVQENEEKKSSLNESGSV